MAINLSKVSYTYFPHRNKKLNTYVLDNATLNINMNGEFIAVVGHTGSGKSTLMQLLNALLIPTSGSIDVDGNLITNKKQKNLKYIRKKIGLVFQFAEYQLFEETVIKDIAFGPINFKLNNPLERAKKACDIVGLNESFYDKSPFKLSGGEMRKVAIAGILASDPDVLILDEPTVGLDPISRIELLNLLSNINKQGKTIIIVTHDMDAVGMLAQRMIVLDDSKIVYDGTKDELFKNEEFVHKHSLDLPDTIKILKSIKKELGLNIDVYQYNIDDAYQELKRGLKNE